LEAKMKIMSVSEAKMKLSSLIDEVSSTDEEVTITKNGRPAAIMISHEEYESLKETAAIRSDKELMDEIRKGMALLRKNKARLYTLEEL
jgi:antitoxin YefM